MTTPLARWFAALALLLVAGCYGRASPASCYEKYISDARGGGEDNYENCLARYERRQAIVRARARGEYDGRRGNVFQTFMQVAAAVAAVRGANGRMYNCTRWMDGSVSCTPQ